MSFPSVIIFGRDTFDEPEPGLGLILRENGIQLFATRLGDPRYDPKGYHYAITPLLAGDTLRDLLSFFERASNRENPDTYSFDLKKDGFRLSSYPMEYWQKVFFFCRAFDSLYDEEEESWGATEVEVDVRLPAWKLFLLCLGQLVQDFTAEQRDESLADTSTIAARSPQPAASEVSDGR